MIIFTAAYAAAEEAAGRPMLNTRIGWHTMTRDAVAADVTASSQTSAGPSDAPLRPDTAEFWLPSSMPATWTLTWTGLQNVDYVAIASHTIGDSGATVTVETSAGQAGSPLADVWEALSSAYTPTDNKPLFFLDTVRDAVKMRITLSGSPTPTEPQISVIHIGLSLWMQQPIRGNHSPLTLSRQTVLHQSLSRGGQFLGQSFRRLGFMGGVSFDLLEADWYRTDFDPFVESARTYPYFIAWRPEERTNELAYVWTAEDIHPAYMGFMDFMTVSWSMIGLDHE